jgi:hypothetical protein
MNFVYYRDDLHRGADWGRNVLCIAAVMGEGARVNWPTETSVRLGNTRGRFSDGTVISLSLRAGDGGRIVDTVMGRRPAEDGCATLADRLWLTIGEGGRI